MFGRYFNLFCEQHIFENIHEKWLTSPYYKLDLWNGAIRIKATLILLTVVRLSPSSPSEFQEWIIIITFGNWNILVEVEMCGKECCLQVIGCRSVVKCIFLLSLALPLLLFMIPVALLLLIPIDTTKGVQWSLGYSSEVKHLLSLSKALGLILSIAYKRKHKFGILGTLPPNVCEP